MRKTLFLFVFVVLVAALSAFVTSLAINRESCPQGQDSYETLNRKLGLSGDQKVTVRQLEDSFEAKERVLRRKLDEANRDLARIIAEENAYTPQVAAAVEHVHTCMGELQKASISHLFELSELLDPEQRKTLMRYVEQALCTPGEE